MNGIMSSGGGTADEPRPAVLLVDDRPEKLLAIQTVLKDMHSFSVERGIGTENSGVGAVAQRHRRHLAGCADARDGRFQDRRGAPYNGKHEAHADPIRYRQQPGSGTCVSGYESGAMDYSPKPLAPHVLMDKVRVFLEMERHRQATQCALAELSRSELELQRSNDAQCIALLTRPLTIQKLQLGTSSLGLSCFEWSWGMTLPMSPSLCWIASTCPPVACTS